MFTDVQRPAPSGALEGANWAPAPPLSISFLIAGVCYGQIPQVPPPCFSRRDVLYPVTVIPNSPPSQAALPDTGHSSEHVEYYAGRLDMM